MPPREVKETIFKGTPVSRGISIGPLFVESRGFAAPDSRAISEKEIEAENQRFLSAVKKTQEQLTQLQSGISDAAGADQGEVFEAHRMVLDDPNLQNRVDHSIKTNLQCAEFSFYQVMQTFLEAMRQVEDPYLRERALDIEDVCQRVLRNFLSTEQSSGPKYPHLLLTYDLAPSDAASIDRDILKGFVTEAGSSNSHTAILARALGIPAIVGIPDLIRKNISGTSAILDGYSGQLIVHPSKETLAHYQVIADRHAHARSRLEELRDKEATTTDGRHITLSANIEFTRELDLVKEQRAEGVGLFRTEFFLLESPDVPDEEAQTKVYTELAAATGKNLSIVRTLDAGGDKLNIEELAETEPNPFLGWRGIRVSLDRHDFFKEQLRAILRASAHGRLGMMFPFISGLSEIRRCLDLVKICQDELTSENIPFDPNLQIGAMIEIPSAAMMAREIAREVDFLSIGTNDLIQYTVAVDRINHRVSHLYRPAHPAVMRLIKMTADAAKEASIWTGVCGEMATDINLTPLLVGLGIDELSVGPRVIAPVKKALRSLHHGDCQKLAAEALQLSTSQEIYRLSEKAAKAAYPDLFDEFYGY